MGRSLSTRGAAERERIEQLGYGALLTLGAALIWGAQFPIAKATFEVIDAFHTTAFRYGAPTLFLVGLLVLKEGWGALRFDRKAGEATLFGVIGMCCSPSLVFGGLMLTRPEIVAVVVATQPSMTAIAEWLVRGRRPSMFTIGCIVAAFLGVVTVITRWSLTMAPSGAELTGDLMVVAGAACWVAYTMANERFRGWSTLRLTALTMLPGGLANLALALVLGWIGLIERPALGDWLQIWPHLIYLSLAGVLLGMVLWNAGTVRIGSLNAMLFLNMLPVITFGIRFAQGHRFETAELVGAAIVIAALMANNVWLRLRAAGQ
ncbi:MAG: DMT family transporter [Burkholderiaceae bacterium]|nr:DMT family transporter [Burkholderiaceae bacterium]